LALFRHSRENGNPVFSIALQILDSRLRGNDDFLRNHRFGYFLRDHQNYGYSKTKNKILDRRETYPGDFLPFKD
jgi:hypothetical protein